MIYQYPFTIHFRKRHFPLLTIYKSDGDAKTFWLPYTTIQINFYSPFVKVADLAPWQKRPVSNDYEF